MAKKPPVTQSGKKGSGQDKGIESLLAKTQRLSEEMNEAQEELRKIRETRRQEVIDAIAQESKRHEETMAELQSKLTVLEAELGIAHEVAVDPAVDPEVIEEQPEEQGVTGYAWDVKKPKKLNMGVDSKGNEYSDEFWDQLLFWPGDSPEATMSSLDNFALLVYYNANGDQVSTPVVASAVKAMGHKSKSSNFNLAVSSANSRLKAEGLVKKGSKNGYHKITPAGKKECRKLIAQQDAIAKGEDPNMAIADKVVISATPSEVQVPDQHITHYIIKAIENSGGKLPGNGLAKAMAQVGYKANGRSASEVSSAIKASLQSLKNRGAISISKDNKSRIQYEMVA